MRVFEVMTDKVDTIGPTESGDTARQKMRLKKIRHLVVTRDSEILGVISLRDLERLGNLPQLTSVEDVMSTPAVTVSPEATLKEVANKMRGRTIGCLPVVERGHLAGIITTTDLLELIGRGAERPTPVGRRWVMKGRGPRRKTVAVN